MRVVRSEWAELGGRRTVRGASYMPPSTAALRGIGQSHCRLPESPGCRRSPWPGCHTHPQNRATCWGEGGLSWTQRIFCHSQRSRLLVPKVRVVPGLRAGLGHSFLPHLSAGAWCLLGTLAPASRLPFLLTAEVSSTPGSTVTAGWSPALGGRRGFAQSPSQCSSQAWPLTPPSEQIRGPAEDHVLGSQRLRWRDGRQAVGASIIVMSLES